MNGILNAGADAVLRQYQSYQLTLVGLFKQCIDELAPTAPAVRTRFSQAALHSQSAFLTATNAILDSTVMQLIDDALRSAGLKPEEHREKLREITVESRSILISSLAAVVQRDADTVARRLRDFAMQVDLMVNATNLTYNAAVIKARIEHGAAFNFNQLDRGNKTWKSADYIRAGVRSYLVSVWMETFLFALAIQGQDLARVKAPADNQFAGLVFSITGSTPGYPTYSQIKAQVWHPNTRAAAERVSNDVPA